MAYDMYCEFDPEKHKQTYVHYLEIVIDQDGHISYAVPSHQEKMIRVACNRLGICKEALYALCPREYWFDMLIWLSMKSGLMAVWENRCLGYKPTKRQIGTLRQLKVMGLYTGRIPKVNEE